MSEKRSQSEILFAQDLVVVLRDRLGLGSFLARKGWVIGDRIEIKGRAKKVGRKGKATNEVRIKVLHDVSFFNKKNKAKFEPRFHFMEQDIVVYDKAVVSPDVQRHFHNFPKGLDFVPVPRAIIEVKYARVTTHDLITYSSKSSRIKLMFPDVRYYFLSRFASEEEEKFLRHGVHFDRIVILGSKPKEKHSYIKGTLLREFENKGRLAGELENFAKIMKRGLMDSRLRIVRREA